MSTKKPVKAKNREHLKELIAEAVAKNGPQCDLNYIDVSDVVNMRSLFKDSPFDGDISRWDVTNVIDMSFMFFESKFNGNISNWNVSNVKTMNCMFFESEFRGNIGKWNVANKTDMSNMFYESALEKNGKIPGWYKKKSIGIVLDNERKMIMRYFMAVIWVKSEKVFLRVRVGTYSDLLPDEPGADSADYCLWSVHRLGDLWRSVDDLELDMDSLKGGMTYCAERPDKKTALQTCYKEAFGKEYDESDIIVLLEE